MHLRALQHFCQGLQHRHNSRGAAAIAPVPPVLMTAKRIFISNAGSDSGLFPHPFSGDPDRVYNEFHANLVSWGRYQIVSSPAQADLIFEIHLAAPTGPNNANKQNGNADPLPMFRLVIYDRPTHYIVWALTESIASATPAEGPRSELRRGAC